MTDKEYYDDAWGMDADNYPAIGLYRDGMIVEFTAYAVGTVISRGIYARGHHTAGWNMSVFRPLISPKVGIVGYGIQSKEKECDCLSKIKTDMERMV